MSDVRRAPALRRVDPVEAAIPDQRPGDADAPPPSAPAPPTPTSSAPVSVVAAPAAGQHAETLSAVLNTRVRPSTRDRLERALNKLRYETNNRNLSIASLTDTALDAWLTDQGV